MANNPTESNLTDILGGDHDFRETFAALLGIFTMVVGTVGNVLILLVTCTWESQGTAFAILCEALAVTDVLSLYTGLVQDVVQGLGHVSPATYPLGCLLAEYSRGTLQTLASWLVVALNLERWHAFTHPFCPRRSGFNAVLLCLSMFLCSFFAHFGVLGAMERGVDGQFGVKVCQFNGDFRILNFFQLLMGIYVKATIPVIVFVVVVSHMAWSQRKKQSTAPLQAAAAAEEEGEAAGENAEAPNAEKAAGTGTAVLALDQNASADPSQPDAEAPDGESAPEPAASQAAAGPPTEPQPGAKDPEEPVAWITPDFLARTDPEGRSAQSLHFLLLLDLTFAALLLPKHAHDVSLYRQARAEGDSPFFVHAESRKTSLLLSSLAFLRTAATFFILLLVSRHFRQNLQRLWRVLRRKKTQPADASLPPADAPLPPADAPLTPTDAPLTPTDAPLTPTDAPLTPTDVPLTPTDVPLTPTDAPLTPTDAPLTPTDAASS